MQLDNLEQLVAEAADARNDPIAQIRRRLEALLEVYPLPWGEVAESGDWWMECGPRDAEGKGAYFITDGLDSKVSTWLEAGPGDLLHVLTEYEHLRNALPGLLRALKEAQACADDLETELRARYEGTLDYPAMRADFERDMAPVVAFRAALEEPRP